ncbi:MAG: potassium-transporting ATPase subunit KdpB [Nitrososphaerota archaeon]|nr:potassium-transporting ATPase subunit KdpB [Nitrososphaerota archaeon]
MASSKHGARKAKSRSRPLLSAEVFKDSVVRLNPVSLASNPVMLIVELAFFIVAAMAIDPRPFEPLSSLKDVGFYAEVAIILLVTVWFSTLSDALAEQEARNTAQSLKRLESEVPSKKVIREEWSQKVVAIPSSSLLKGDLVLLEKGDLVPTDAEVLEGIAMLDESLVTGESAPVRKAPGDTLIGGSLVVSNTLTVRVAVGPGESYINGMIKMVEAAKRPKTPNEQAVTMVLVGLTAIFTIIIASLAGLSVALNLGGDLSAMIALYVCLLPTTIGALLPAIGLSGVSRLYERKVVAKSGKAIEAAGDADVILLDKTGTITVGNRQAVEFIPLDGHSQREVGEAAFLASWFDDTPEGRSIVRLSYEAGAIPRELNGLERSRVYEFSATTRTSGIVVSRLGGLALPKSGKEFQQQQRLSRKFADSILGAVSSDETEIIKGAPDALRTIAPCSEDFDRVVDGISNDGGTPIGVVRDGEVLGVVRLKDVLKPDIGEKVRAVKTMGIRPVMITGDQPLTAKSIAKEVGIEEYVPQARPNDKYDVVRREQAESRIVAMIGDGTNDAPALAASDIGLAMNSGTEPAKEAANMVDLESSPAKIIDVVMLGKQLLVTRGAVTTFSIANDVAKYFAIVPVLFATTVPQLQSLNVLQLGLNTAVLSALIFNAVIIPLLIPLAMRGVAFKPSSTMSLFLRNTLIYGVGGVIAPFVGIKAIDILLSLVHP